MIIISNAASFLAQRAVPAVANAAMSNPITATVVTVGAVGLAAWKGSEVAIKSAPLTRTLKEKMHNWTAPDAVKQAAHKAAADVHQAATVAELQAAATAASAAAEKAAGVAEAARRAADIAVEAAAEVLPPRHLNGAGGYAEAA